MAECDSETSEVDSGSLSCSYLTPNGKEQIKKHTPYSDGKSGSPREAELSNSLINLKIGFRQREEQLQLQLAIHKEAIYELYIINQKLRSTLNLAGAATCDQLGTAEELAEQSALQHQSLQDVNQGCHQLPEKLAVLQEEKDNLETVNEELRRQLHERHLDATNSTAGVETSAFARSLSERESATKVVYDSELAQASPTSIMDSADLPRSDVPGFVDNASPSPVLRNGKSATKSRSQEGSRRDSAGANGQYSTGSPARRSSSARSSYPSAERDSSRGRRKPAVPTRDELAAAITPRRRSMGSINTHSPVRRDISTTNKENKPRGAGGAPLSPSAPASSPTPKPPRVSLRSRIEALSQGSMGMENNPWLGAFSTTNRSSTGGCQFFVDVLSENSGSGKGRKDYEDVGNQPQEDAVSAEELGAECSDVREESVIVEQEGGGEEVMLLDIDATDLQNLSQCSERSFHAAEGVADGSSSSVSTYAIAGAAMVAQPRENGDTAEGPVLMNSAAQQPDCAATATREAWIASAESADSYHAPTWSGEHGLRGLESPKLEIPELSLSDSVRHDDEQDFPVSPFSTHYTALHSPDSPDGVHLGRDAVEEDAFGAMFIELHDAGVQCEPLVTPTAVDASSNTESDWLQPPPQAVSINTETVSYTALANDKFVDAMEETKFALGKKLFDLRYGGDIKKALAPPTPLAPRKGAGRTSLFEKNDAAAPPPLVRNTVIAVRTSPRGNQSAVNAANSVGKLSAPGGNELAKLNADLITKLREQADLTARGQRKVQLLEKKLCHLIMYVKRTAREAAVKGVPASQGVQTSPTRTSTGPTETMPVQPNARRMPPQRRPVIPPGASQAVYPRAAPATAPHPSRPPAPAPAPTASTPAAVNQSMNVGSMSFAAGLDNLLCLGDDNEDDDEQGQLAPNRSLFSPMKDFQGRNYDDQSDNNISIQSNPLLRRAPDTIPTPGAQDRSVLELSFHPERSYMDTPEMASLSSGLQSVDAFSPISRNQGATTTTTSSVAVVQGPRQNLHAVLQNNSNKPLLQNRTARPGGPAARAQRQIVNPLGAPVEKEVGGSSMNHSSPVRGQGNSPMGSPVRRLFPAAAPVRNAEAGGATGAAKGAVGTAAAQQETQGEELRRQLAQTHRTVQKLEQSVDYLKIRNKNLLREKQLLTTKLQHALENDTDSLNLQIYSDNQEIALNNPTKTMSIVMGFMENNNRLLDEIDTMKAQLNGKVRQVDAQSQELQTLRNALLEAQQHNRVLSQQLDGAQQVSAAAQAERQQLQRQVGDMTYSAVHLSQENKLLRERLRLY